jgi:hypothetical protein
LRSCAWNLIAASDLDRSLTSVIAPIIRMAAPLASRAT